MANGAALQVALLEDDTLLRDRVLMPGLANFGFAVSAMETAAQLRAHLQARQVDIVVLDLGLPDSDGFSVTRELRRDRPQLGVVMLTARRGSDDQVRGLNEGADAYLTKPVELGVLAATLYSVARRMETGSGLATSAAAWALQSDGWGLGSPCGAVVPLTRSERLLLRRMFLTCGQVVAREALVQALAAPDPMAFDPHRLESMIHRLRRKVASLAAQPLPLMAVHGEGYVLRIGAPSLS